MSKFLEGFCGYLSSVIYATIDATGAWWMWNQVFDLKVNWCQSFVICLIVISLIRSGTSIGRR